MSIFNDLLPKLSDISNVYFNKLNEGFKAALESLDRFEEQCQNSRRKSREIPPKIKTRATALQIIDEDEGEKPVTPDSGKSTDNEMQCSSNSSDEKATTPDSGKSTDNEIQIDDHQARSSTSGRRSMKRNKDEVDGMNSPQFDKRQKRNASVKALTSISKQVNVNLTQKLRREDSISKTQPSRRPRKEESNREGKENQDPIIVKVKEEKMSLPPEPIDVDTLPLDIDIKSEPVEIENAMPPPTAPAPKSKQRRRKSKEDKDWSGDEESSGRRVSTRTKKQSEAMPPPPVPMLRTTRASSRASSRNNQTDVQIKNEPTPIPEGRPKRTRTKKKVSDSTTAEITKETNKAPVQNEIASPADKPRPKRTRRGRKAEEETQPPPVKERIITPEQERVSEPEQQVTSLILNIPKKNQTPKLTTSRNLLESNQAENKEQKVKESKKNDESKAKLLQRSHGSDTEVETSDNLEKTQLLVTTQESEAPRLVQNNMNETVVLPNGVFTQKTHETVAKPLQRSQGSDTEVNTPGNLEKTQLLVTTQKSETPPMVQNQMNETVVLPNGVFIQETHKTVFNMNVTMTLESRYSGKTDADQPKIMNSTVIIDKDGIVSQLTADNSILTDDESEVNINCTPEKTPPAVQPTSAVKAKVQQFEELASRVTRTKTRALAKKIEDAESHQTPPDKVSSTISADTLNKMNNMIFNGKPLQITSSANKPRANLPPLKHQPLSTSKLSAINKHREAAAEEERECAKKKKEALLEARKEQQKRKREEKMAAAAAAREAAERERQQALEAAQRERREKQAHANLGKLERLKEVERKKQDLARKVAETEERRKAEELARMQRLAEEQKRAEALRRKQQEEHEIMKKEAAIMAKEMERKRKEYLEKQKMRKMQMEAKNPVPVAQPLSPVYMSDGFQYLNSDSDDERGGPKPPVPLWYTSKNRNHTLSVQAHISTVHIDKLFSVSPHSPDVTHIFPQIERQRTHRTSSAVWRTPPNRLPTVS